MTDSAPATDSAAAPALGFAELGVPAPLVASLAERGITAPFPIQAATLPDTLAGRDVLGRGRTGSGKTIAFGLPLVARLARGPRAGASRPRGLVLAPTRELANQIADTLTPLAKAVGLRVSVVFGGVSQGPQVSALKGGVDILVACPGRLEDLLGQRALTLDAVEVAVLDEADHMADLGFLPGVRRILDRTPQGGQRMLFSATLDNGVDVLVKRYLSSPVTHSVDPASSPVSALTHHVFEVADVEAKRSVVEALASGTGRRLLFLRTKHQARQMARRLTESGIPAADLHGNLSQNARERNLAAFSSGEVRVMVATDIAARGIHVDDVDLVVHVDPPTEHKAYLHRSGRTARAGAGGDVVTLMLPEQRSDVATLLRLAKIRATPQRVRPTDEAVTALVGEVAARVAPADAPSGAARKPEPSAASGGGRRKGRPASGVGSTVGGRSTATRTTAQPGSRTSAPGSRGGAGGGAGAGKGGPSGAPNGRRRGQRTAAQGPAGESRGHGTRGSDVPGGAPRGGQGAGRGGQGAGRGGQGAGRGGQGAGRGGQGQRSAQGPSRRSGRAPVSYSTSSSSIVPMTQR
ncbi:DEAD/DEAH box helicase [Miniimonas arenae]|uniref:DEAD/DEAH box helicase n=2 Tax=Miniimonas arenae TaxID=676201 RepID=UPI001C55A231|nr:DEAD/DEAH box helicase [Miniimonas arenae]